MHFDVPALVQQRLGDRRQVARRELEPVALRGLHRLEAELEQPDEVAVLGLGSAPDDPLAGKVDDRRPRVAGVDLQLAVGERELRLQRWVRPRRRRVGLEQETRPRRDPRLGEP